MAVAGVAAGCGGTPHYTLEKTSACLRERGLTVRPPRNDFIASSAPAGSVNARLRRNQVTIAFGDDGEGGARLAAAYRRFRGQNVGESGIEERQNAALVWGVSPEPADRDLVHGCLK